MSKYRFRVRNKSGDKRYFSKTADKIKAVNLARPMRGGIRL